MPSFISLIVASVLGALIGLERESAGKAAGLRTRLLVGVGAAAMIGMAAGVEAWAQAVFVTCISLIELGRSPEVREVRRV